MAVDFSKMAPIRQLLQNVGNVQWNPERNQFGNRSINVNGMNLEENKDFYIDPTNDRAYGDFTKLSNTLGSYALKPFDPNDLTKYQTQAKQYANVAYQPKLNALDGKLAELQSAADAQRDNTRSAYDDARANLQINKREGQSQTNSNITGRGLQNSQLSEYLRQDTANKFMPMQKNIETEQARQLANISNQTANNIASLGNEYAMLEADRAQKEMDYSNQYYQQDKTNMMNMANLLSQQGQMNTQAEQQAFANKLAEAGLTQEWNGNPTFQRLLSESGMTGMWDGQPTWQRSLQEQELKNQKQQRDLEIMYKNIGLTGMMPDGTKTWERMYQEGQLGNDTLRATGAGQSNMTAGERQNQAVADYFNKINARYNENVAKGLQNPGYYAVKSALADPEWMTEATKAGINPQDAVNMFLRSKNSNPDDFFTGTAGQLRGLYDQYSSPGKSTQLTQAKQEALGQAYSVIDNAYNQGYTPEQLKAEVRKDAGSLAKRGVKVQDLLDYIDQNYY